MDNSLFSSSRQLNSRTRVSSSGIRDLNDLDDQFKIFNTIVHEAEDRVETINSALSAIGIVSPFRKTEEIIPRFGELHMHMKSHLSQNNAYAVSLMEKKRKFQRRKEFLCRLQINSFIEAFSSLDEISCKYEGQNGPDTEGSTTSSLLETVKNTSNSVLTSLREFKSDVGNVIGNSNTENNDEKMVSPNDQT
eukprot:CAMPEP_0197839196 /NCGR_PEP_ID=MMETSP1437-20131217/41599_1 /TAXON_ID=49252 ORGANISM="Eucampia antarctica, Strain CCMP1452" /NCGR_SAMPLE_ID=MMETSP1437 /ASSEMBLY_ACC=CAM_ASM_001096 /LENGTH=191 /DNA_ID=CAMNT_0043448029 /DNA_START=576 /DNA_END=1148 /DNA_ORIENTATION=+